MIKAIIIILILLYLYVGVYLAVKYGSKNANELFIDILVGPIAFLAGFIYEFFKDLLEFFKRKRNEK